MHNKQEKGKSETRDKSWMVREKSKSLFQKHKTNKRKERDQSTVEKMTRKKTKIGWRCCTYTRIEKEIEREKEKLYKKVVSSILVLPIMPSRQYFCVGRSE
eukprot:5638641-Pyramimonas_sp.AAC.1